MGCGDIGRRITTGDLTTEQKHLIRIGETLCLIGMLPKVVAYLLYILVSTVVE